MVATSLLLWPVAGTTPVYGVAAAACSALPSSSRRTGCCAGPGSRPPVLASDRSVGRGGRDAALPRLDHLPDAAVPRRRDRPAAAVLTALGQRSSAGPSRIVTRAPPRGAGPIVSVAAGGLRGAPGDVQPQPGRAGAAARRARRTVGVGEARPLVGDDQHRAAAGSAAPARRRTGRRPACARRRCRAVRPGPPRGRRCAARTGHGAGRQRRASTCRPWSSASACQNSTRSAHHRRRVAARLDALRGPVAGPRGSARRPGGSSSSTSAIEPVPVRRRPAATRRPAAAR